MAFSDSDLTSVWTRSKKQRSLHSPEQGQRSAQVASELSVDQLKRPRQLGPTKDASNRVAAAPTDNSAEARDRAPRLPM